MMSEVGTCGLHCGSYVLSLFLCVRKFHCQQLENSIAKCDEKDKDLLLSRSDEHHVALVEGQLAHGRVVACKNCLVVFEGLRVLLKRLFANQLDFLEYAPFIPPADVRHIGSHVLVVLLFRWLIIKLLLDFIEHFWCLIKLTEAKEGYEIDHDCLFEID